jgi:hypothetical protein
MLTGDNDQDDQVVYGFSKKWEGKNEKRTRNKKGIES